MSHAFEQARARVRELPGCDLWAQRPGQAPELALAGRAFAVVHRAAPRARWRVVLRANDLLTVERWVSQAALQR